MVNHQPFETWNLDRSRLQPEQQAELMRHLETCPDCREKYAAWERVQMELKFAPVMNAPAGFSARFQASLEARRAEAQRRQTRNLLGFLGISLLVILILLTIYVLNQTSPAVWISSILRAIADVPVNLLELRYIAAFWLPRISPLIWVAVEVILLGWLADLVLTGTFTYKRFMRQGTGVK
jgi:anti-sigma factor RsiW